MPRDIKLAVSGAARVAPYARRPPKVARNSFKVTTSVMQDTGRVLKLQGYENFGMRDLLQHWQPRDIVHRKCDMPKIHYFSKDRKLHQYIPDYWLPKANLIVEVKSQYTFEVAIDINLAKKKACLDSGFAFEFWIYDKKGTRVNE